jgi:predicted  nucleic acid-binding Zn-ribbon protein
MNDPGFQRSELHSLLELQRLDSEIARVRQAIDRTIKDPDVEARREQALQATQAAVAAKERLSKINHTVTWEEKESDSTRAEINGIERKMYGGLVSSSKELDQMGKRVEQLRVELGRHEEAGIAAIVEAEEAALHLGQAVKAQDTALDRLDDAETKQNAAGAAFEAEVRALEPQRAARAAQVPGAARSRYERVRASCGGVGVGALGRDGRCGACLVGVPVLLAEKVRAGRLEVCDSCGRLLVRSFEEERQ